jgi:5'-3' exonuclease
MKTNLIIDGNYLLNRLTFTLHKNNLLYGALSKSLENSINNYKRWYPFTNIYLVSDSKERSWRKNIYSDYKATRKKDSDIDWNFVFETYKNFKNSLTSVKVLEAPTIEGDDWISYVVNKSNLDSMSTIIVSNDYDIKQLIRFEIEPLVINIMANEIYNKQKIFLPENYQLFLYELKKLPNNDIFDLNDNKEFISFLEGFVQKYDVNIVNWSESLFIKLVSGDKGDNIESAWSQVKNGKKRGIGERGAKTIYDDYLKEFGSIDWEDSDLYENIADLICEKKKLSKYQIQRISSKINYNSKIINLNLSNIPKEIVCMMEKIYEESRRSFISSI